MRKLFFIVLFLVPVIVFGQGIRVGLSNPINTQLTGVAHFDSVYFKTGLTGLYTYVPTNTTATTDTTEPIEVQPGDSLYFFWFYNGDTSQVCIKYQLGMKLANTYYWSGVGTIDSIATYKGASTGAGNWVNVDGTSYRPWIPADFNGARYIRLLFTTASNGADLTTQPSGTNLTTYRVRYMKVSHAARDY